MTERTPHRRDTSRGQANIAVLGISVLLLTIVTGMSIALADGAIAGADREPLERHAAGAVADRLVSPDTPTALRANVLLADRMDTLTPAEVDRLVPVAAGRDIRVRLGEKTIVSRGSLHDGTTMRRIVLVAEQTSVTRTVPLQEGEVTLPRRTSAVRVDIRPAPGTTVETVRANDRIVLHNASGLTGTARVPISRFETTTLAFETRGPGRGRGTVTVTYFPVRTTKAVLEVTVDA